MRNSCLTTFHGSSWEVVLLHFSRMRQQHTKLRTQIGDKSFVFYPFWREVGEPPFGNRAVIFAALFQNSLFENHCRTTKYPGHFSKQKWCSCRSLKASDGFHAWYIMVSRKRKAHHIWQEWDYSWDNSKCWVKNVGKCSSIEGVRTNTVCELKHYKIKKTLCC